MEKGCINGIEIPSSACCDGTISISLDDTDARDTELVAERERLIG